ncbi:hypothetical protein K3495_g15289, partial [Podosphaera aphanis]
IGTLAAALKRTRDTTDTDKAKIRGGLKTAIKPPRKKRSTLALQENTESVPLNNIKTHHPTQGNDPPSSNLRSDKDSRNGVPSNFEAESNELTIYDEKTIAPLEKIDYILSADLNRLDRLKLPCSS